ncbi:hypothetical protein [Ralstonia flaminis]|jgi:hypothetical protein|uniref:Lipoprotein n=1 Tax=Ralstonia flaminis TaxID=3058597 RepID=A0ABN9JMG3_9RALS|nr:hypothetical protein [Ralstonia sp. LMG 18101]CAJ0817765.1 hypothetical protein LMG18101_03381 [Ralstonia sp. LMG 18101]
MLKLAIFAVLCASLSGCATSGRIGDLPTIAAGAPSSSLVLIRPSSLVGATNSYYVALDGKDVFSIRSGENTQFPIPSGEHTVSVKCFGGWSPTWKEDGKQFVAVEGQSSYFEINPNLTCAKIMPMPAEAAKTQLAATKFVNPANVSNK